MYHVNNWVFDNFISADELLVKAVQILETCVSVNNSLYTKLVSLLESIITFDEKFKVTLVSVSIPDFN